MPDRHQHDRFIWALLLSFIINIVMVFALMAHYNASGSAKFQPVFVSIEMGGSAFQNNSSPRPLPGATVKAATARRRVDSPSISLPQKTIAVSTLPAKEQNKTIETAIRPVMPTAMAGDGTDTPLSAPEGLNVRPATTRKTAGDMSIMGDKITGDNYTAPQRLGDEIPHYPKYAERQGWGGTVLLSIVINASGEVVKVGMIKTSGYELLDQQAKKAVQAWRFTPARRNGIAVPVTVLQEILFRRPFPGNDL